MLARGNDDSAKTAPPCDMSHGRGFFVEFGFTRQAFPIAPGGRS